MKVTTSDGREIEVESYFLTNATANGSRVRVETPRPDPDWDFVATVGGSWIAFPNNE